MVSTRQRISKFACPCTNHWVTVPSTLITIGITVTFMLHSFFRSLRRFRYFSLSFSFTLWSAGTSKSTIRLVLFFLLSISWSGRLVEIGWTVYISKSRRTLCVSFSRTDSGLCTYHLFVGSNLNFLLNFYWITFPIQSCLVLYILFTLTCCIRLLCNWSIRLCHHRINICYFIYLVYSCFDIVNPYGVVLYWYHRRFSFSLKVSLSFPFKFSRVSSPLILLFFPFLFSCYFLFYWWLYYLYCFWSL